MYPYLNAIKTRISQKRREERRKRRGERENEREQAQETGGSDEGEEANSVRVCAVMDAVRVRVRVCVARGGVRLPHASEFVSAKYGR